MCAFILDIRRSEELSLLKPLDDPKKKKKKDKVKEIDDCIIDMDAISGTGNIAFTSFHKVSTTNFWTMAVCGVHKGVNTLHFYYVHE